MSLRPLTNLLGRDKPTIIRILPNRKPGTRCAPSVHHFFVSSLALCEPLEKIKDQRFDYRVCRRIFRVGHFELNFTEIAA